MTNHWQETLLRILQSDTNSLLELAKIAGSDPKTFYLTADFNGVDLERIDTRGVSLPKSVLPNGEGETQWVVRLPLRVSPAIHELLKAGNPNGLSAHVSVLLRVFLDEHLDSWKENRPSSQKLEAILIEKLAPESDAQSDYLLTKSSRRPVTYYIESNLKERLVSASLDQNRSLSELSRIGIYYTLLYDRIRNLGAYSRLYRDSALEALLLSKVLAYKTPLSVELSQHQGKPVSIRRVISGSRVIYEARRKANEDS